jgi:hypothetical protein
MLYRLLATLGLAVVLALSTAPSEAAKPKPTAAKKNKGRAKKSEHTHHGVIEKVSLGSKEGSITIKEHHHKKKGKGKTAAKGSSSKEETFHIGPGTKIEKNGKPVSASELKKGEHVIIHSSGKVAEKIDIVHHKHKKKKTAKKKKATT